MGTNYYGRQISKIEEIEAKREKVLEELNVLHYASPLLWEIVEGHFQIKLNDIQDIHIGKASMGWKFLFNHNDWQYYTDKESLYQWLDTVEIVDEYGRKVTKEWFINLIESKEDHPKSAMDVQKNWKYYIHKDGLRFSTPTSFS
jgi:hypothetical protein